MPVRPSNLDTSGSPFGLLKLWAKQYLVRCALVPDYAFVLSTVVTWALGLMYLAVSP